MKLPIVHYSIKKMVESPEDQEHVQMIEVPKAQFSTIKEQTGHHYKFYSNVLQISVRNSAILVALDDEYPSEISYVENIDLLQDPDKLVNSGFMLSSS